MTKTAELLAQEATEINIIMDNFHWLYFLLDVKY